MVGRSKIVEISRNVPFEKTDPPAVEEGQEMIAAVKMDDEPAHIEASLQASDPEAVTYSQEWDEPIEATPRRWKAIITGGLLISLFLGWTGFFVWANAQELQQFSQPARIAELIGLWAVPTALLALCWLLAMRLSSTEAMRFGDVASLLRAESEALEVRMRNVNGEISLARSFLAENARELESVGRLSAKKLTEAAEQLVVALADSEQKGQVLQNVSSAAVSNVELLRNHLPVVTSAAKDATNNIGNAGSAANQQIQALVASVQGMNEAISATSSTMTLLEQQTEQTSRKIGAAATEAETTLATATANSEKSATALLSLLQSEITSVEQRLGDANENISALGETNSQRLGEQIELIRAALAEVSEAGEQQDGRVGEIVARIEAALDTSQSKLAAIDGDATARFDRLVTRLRSSIDDCDTKLGAIDSSATDRIAKLAFAINALTESSSELSVNLASNQEQATIVLGNAERLMLALDNISRELGDDIPAAFTTLQSRFAESGETMRALAKESHAIDEYSASLTKRMAELDALVKSQRASVEALVADSNGSLNARRQEADALAASLNATHSLIADVGSTAEEQLSGSLKRVAEAAYEAANSSKAIVESELADIGERLTEQNKALLAGAIDAQLAGLGSAVNDAITRNLTLSEEATQRVSAQLQSVNELTANLEQRALAARERFDGIDDEAFARRVALLTESLNSAAIDVAKILSNEVTDTAWAAYLKGDRGVFTRRAVRLLDSGEARIIATQYDEDTEFRDHVNRYIHDFESMMRVLLSTRDGNAIGVTLLSSDVGKLYVALAQAIDRLRN
jgi:hypothetical protein